MMALVDDKRIFGEVRGRYLVCAKKPDDLGGGSCYGRGRDREADFVGTCAGCGALENVEALPFRSKEVGGVFVDKRADGFEDGFCVWVLRYSGTDDDEGSFGGGQEFTKGTRQGLFQGRVIDAEVLDAESGVEGFANEADFEVGADPLFADAGVEDCGFVARVGADEEDGVCFFDTVDFGVEGVGGADVDAVGDGGGTLGLVQSEIIGVEGVGEIFHGDEGLGIDEMAGDGFEFVGRRSETVKGGGNFCERHFPSCRLEFVIPPYQRVSKSLCLQAVAGETGFVIYPFLIHIVIESRKYPHDLHTPSIHPYVRTQCIKYVH